VTSSLFLVETSTPVERAAQPSVTSPLFLVEISTPVEAAALRALLICHSQASIDPAKGSPPRQEINRKRCVSFQFHFTLKFIAIRKNLIFLPIALEST
jgi:hypothetical protein